MLELTQTKDGQITGSLNGIELRSDGSIDPRQESISGGTLDGSQLTLKFGGLLGVTLTGTLKWNTIQLHSIGQRGDFQAFEFHRGSPETFKTYADELKRKGQSIVMTSQAANQIPQIRLRIQAAESWISEAELHAGRIPGVKEQYRNIEDRMKALVMRERATSGGVARGQIAVAVNQGAVAGNQADIQVDQMWDIQIGNPGYDLNNDFARLSSKCPARDELSKRGVEARTADDWESACEQAVSERSKFMPIFKRIMEQRAELKAFQVSSQTRRQALVDEASRMQ